MKEPGNRRIQMWFRKKKASGDLDQELRFHLENEIELNIARGMSTDEARRQALIAFGGVQQTREAVKQTRWSHIPETLFQDLRYAWRMLRTSPGFTAVAVLTLALGISLDNALFSLFDAVLFRNLPASHPEELVFVKWHARHRPKMIGSRSYGYCRNNFEENSATACSFSVPFFNEVRSRGVFSQQAAF